ncbi:MAG: hypothetical protein MZV65_34115 [Chromatiales bacterium]|nr:hypothetical protein [Chromatiales bacterium]
MAPTEDADPVAHDARHARLATRSSSRSPSSSTSWSTWSSWWTSAKGRIIERELMLIKVKRQRRGARGNEAH